MQKEVEKESKNILIIKINYLEKPYQKYALVIGWILKTYPNIAQMILFYFKL